MLKIDALNWKSNAILIYIFGWQKTILKLHNFPRTENQNAGQKNPLKNMKNTPIAARLIQGWYIPLSHLINEWVSKTFNNFCVYINIFHQFLEMPESILYFFAFFCVFLHLSVFFPLFFSKLNVHVTALEFI